MSHGNAALLTDDSDNRELDVLNHSLGSRLATVAGCALLLIACVLHAALPVVPFDGPPPEVTIAARTLLPQGWAFFTKSPRSEDPVAYQRSQDGRWHSITAGPLAQPRDLMGLNRMGRAQGTEMAMVLTAVPQEAWHDCSRAPIGCLEDRAISGTAVNESNHRSICGEIGFVVQQVLPWAWRDAPTTMPSKVLRVRVTC